MGVATISWLLVVLLFTLLGAVGGYFFKKATSHGFALNTYFFKHLIVGCSFYGAGAILNIITLNYLPYTIVFPLTSITYVWTLIISYFLLKEVITLKKVIGVTLIIAGSFFLIL
ncbi:undecaprenyl phosphate-alpha-L-ara4N flippase subunit ArnE [Halobacillus alkaliphilus]|uniref:Undecaprenyl phosphate-alpha-L-ara4N flippase subunit ArnE n=1 Tax=Halobacillus alkaliphilus TaxID=396056 RepID=A0A1I2LD37_9BACI|nr:EamA family transporter [Halobacillus alkaliphilus]SFF77194.1 undecaprenyl phosphate-alpha-L-ara4N flippase subunit ArnE [Halobacillus alkaliphilus]